MIEKSAWSFYAGIKNNEPLWKKDEKNAVPIFTDPAHVGHPTITYNANLKRYILCITSDVVPHREDASRDEMRKWNWESELQLYESENVWGPWYIFHNDNQWGGSDHTCYLLQMPSAWLSKDGLSGSILFAGDYVNRKSEYYGFMTQSFKLTLYSR